MVAEDNNLLRFLMTKLLTNGGISHTTDAVNGAEALEQYRRTPEGYRLILMDVMMPVLDGMQATAQIRALEKERNLARVPIIGITAMDNEIDCLASGMDAYYQKPFSAIQLKEILEKWIPNRDETSFI
jgi:CheY-like chemotaxis protein